MEIERKFIVNEKRLPFKLNRLVNYYITQSYLDTGDKSIVRIRRIKDIHGKETYKLEFKTFGLLSREEICLNIDYGKYLELFSICKTSLSKTRYIFPYNKFTFEIDVYEDYDFITLEVEFNSEEQANSFEPLDWFGEEITYDKKYKNNNLAKLI